MMSAPVAERYKQLQSIALASARAAGASGQHLRALCSARDNIQDLWSALSMVRGAIEELGPVGVLRSGDAVTCVSGPEPHNEAEALVRGIQKIADERDLYKKAWEEVSDRWEALLLQLGGHDA